MDRDEGLRILSERGWLSGTPDAFQRAILSGCRWYRLDAGAEIQAGDEPAGELIGLAQGAMEMRTSLSVADTPMLMHLSHPVFWIGYGPIIDGKPRRVPARAKTPVWLASTPHSIVKRLLDERPEWWKHVVPLAFIYGDLAATVAADLLIRGSERRCAAVMLRLCGHRFAAPTDIAPVETPITQDDLAGAANVSRNTAGTALRKLAARGLIELGYRGIIVRSPAALRAIVDSA